MSFDDAIPGDAGKTDREELEQSLAWLKANADIQDEIHQYKASKYYSCFSSLLDAGFTEEQAMQLICARGTD